MKNVQKMIKIEQNDFKDVNMFNSIMNTRNGSKLVLNNN